MMQQGLKHFTDTQLIVLGLMIFFCLYLGAIVWTFWVKSNQENLDKISRFPLQDEEKVL